jgi:hypothetical protein
MREIAPPLYEGWRQPDAAMFASSWLRKVSNTCSSHARRNRFNAVHLPGRIKCPGDATLPRAFLRSDRHRRTGVAPHHEIESTDSAESRRGIRSWALERQRPPTSWRPCRGCGLCRVDQARRLGLPISSGGQQARRLNSEPHGRLHRRPTPNQKPRQGTGLKVHLALPRATLPARTKKPRPGRERGFRQAWRSCLPGGWGTEAGHPSNARAAQSVDGYG